MRTEEYIIILVGVTANDQEVVITYTSEAHGDVSVQVTYSNGRIVKVFEHVKNATNGVLTFPSEGLLPGSYTCTILENGKTQDNKDFSIA